MIPSSRVVPFKAWHYEWLLKHESAEPSKFAPPRATIEALERENSWTGVVGFEVMVVAGTIQQWPGRHVAWAYIRQDAGPHMLRLTKEVGRKLLDVKGRIEFTVRKDFEAGQRWAELIGFEVETPLLKAYGPEGEDHVAYVRLQP